MAVFRILEGRARPGRVDEIARMFEAQAEAVGGTKGIAFVQVLRSDDQILGISCWRSGEDMQRYLEQDATREFYSLFYHVDLTETDLDRLLESANGRAP